MDIWITSVEWESPSEKLPSFSAENWLKIEASCEEVIADVIAEAYQSYPDNFSYRLYEPGSTVPSYINKAISKGGIWNVIKAIKQAEGR